MTETATPPNPTEAADASTQTSTTLLATAGGAADTTQQTQAQQTQQPPVAEATVQETPKPGETQTPVVPDKYEFKAPEGSEFDPEVVESFSGAAKKAGLSQDAAQKVIEEMAPVLIARQVDQVKAIHEEWRTASSADAEFGGEKLAENLGVARKALEGFGTPELRKLLDETGLGNHPEVIRLLFNAGKAISEDKFVGGAARGGGVANPVGVLYDKTPKG